MPLEQRLDVAREAWRRVVGENRRRDGEPGENQRRVRTHSEIPKLDDTINSAATS
jgi:hypothetical protein